MDGRLQEKGEWSDADLEAVMDRSSLFPVRQLLTLPVSAQPDRRILTSSNLKDAVCAI